MLKDFRNHFESLVFINDVFECYLDFHEIDTPQSNLSYILKIDGDDDDDADD